MAIFVLIGVLRGFPVAAYRRTSHRKPLCGLDQNKNCPFLNWTPIVFILDSGWTQVVFYPFEKNKKMRKYFLYLQLIFLSVLLFGKTALIQEWNKVKWINDGDTIVLTDGRHVRYIGINAPEIAHDHHKAEAFGYAAKKINQSLLRSKMVRLEFDKEKYDRYGRLLAYIFLLDGTFINKKMIEKGYAYVLHRRPNVKYDGVLLKAQRDAMSKNQGMWRNWSEKEGEEYWGSKKSKRFHLKTCPYGKRIKHRNRVIFTRKWDAFWSGFAPCRQCMRGGN